MVKKIILLFIFLSAVLLGYYLFQKVPGGNNEEQVQGEVSGQGLINIDGTDLTVTDAGLAIKRTNSDSKPVVFLPEGVTLEENQRVTNPELIFALKLTKDLTKSDFTPTQIRFVDKVDVIVYSQSEATARFTVLKDSTEQVDSLQLVLSKAKINASKISQIDLRFNKPVVTYKK